MDMTSASLGLVRRVGRLFDPATWRSVIVALDHGAAGVPDGFARPEQLLETIVAAAPDGVILNPGLARRCPRLFERRDAPALVLSLDQILHERPRWQGPAVAHWPQLTVEEALRLGADAVKLILIIGRPDARELAADLAYVARTAEACRRWDLPLMVEPYLWGADVPADPVERARLNADGARIAVEHGADLLKLEVGGEPGIFGQTVQASPVPVFVLGGPKRPTQRETLADVVAAAAAGAVGLTIGRNVWQHADPQGMVRALRTALAEQDLEAALACLGHARVAGSTA
jgi:DhnA family fructose-bisphosphate aldolase class Ia